MKDRIEEAKKLAAEAFPGLNIVQMMPMTAAILMALEPKKKSLLDLFRSSNK